MRAEAPEPVDSAARARIATALDESLFVDAGAGSGKTTALVGRVVELVRAGHAIGSIAAITFTEAAAAELRERLRNQLRSAATDATDLFEQQRFAEALDGLDGAAIQTLHAFAQRLLRQHPIEAGLPPAVDVADELESVVRFEARWRRFLDDWEDDDAWQPTLRRFLLVGGQLKHLSELARVFNDHWDRLAPLPPGGVGAIEPAALPPVEVGEIVEHLALALSFAPECRDPDDNLLRHLETTIAPALQVLASASDDERVLLVAGSTKLECGFGKAPQWNGRKPEVVEALASAEAARQALRSALVVDVVVAVQRRIAAFVIESAEARRRAGRLEFHDLLVLARDLLRDDAGVRAALAEGFDALLLDEFQDTDPIQLELAELLARGGTDAAAPGRLFFVGDPKQSIYRFRRADLAVYLQARADLSDGLCELTANFRTVPGVVDWVNGVFAHLMGEAADGAGSAQAPYRALSPTRAALPGDHPPVVVAGGAIEAVAAEVRQQSASDLAAILRTMLDEGWAVHDSTGDGPTATRPVALDDICVLVPSRLAIPALEDAFDDARLPYRLLTSTLIWSAQEVREVLAVLRAIADPGDEVALVAAVRSPILACTDGDLFSWRRAGGRWSYLLPGAPSTLSDHPVAVAFDVLAALHHDRWWLGPDGLIDRLLAERGVLESSIVAGRRRDRWRRLRTLADQAQHFVERQQGDLGAFLEWIDLQSSDVVRVSSPVLPEPDDPSIRVMTIHGAKGLEFPVVALFGLGVATRSRAKSVLWSGETPEVRLASKLASSGYDDLFTAEEQMDRAERVRLLYVGATRARDRLVVCTHHKATAKASKNPALGALFERALEELDPALTTRWESPAILDLAGAASPIDPSTLVRAPDDPAVDAVLAARSVALGERDALVVASPRAVWSATAVARAADATVIDDEDPADQPTSDDAAVTWRRGRAGTAIGRAVHGTLQLVDLATLERLDPIARAQASAEGVARAADQVAALARAGATSPLVRDLVGRRHWREMYVAAPVEGVTVEGYVDLLADDGDGGLVVVDYKTDIVRGQADVDARTGRYRLQAATYALALEAVAGRPVSRAAFLFLGRDGAIASDVVDLGAAMADARRVLRGEPLDATLADSARA